MFSFFSDLNSNKVDFEHVDYSMLTQLEDAEEGYALEFKSCFDTSVKNKLPSIIASFANVEGGLIVIGIENKSHRITPILKEDIDWSQRIGVLATEYISPTPAITVRFLEDPDSPNQGVLLVMVLEGNEPPYVSKGTVYIRSGSSTEPKKAESNDIIALLRKREAFIARQDEFFRRSVFLPLDGRASAPSCAVFSVFLFNARGFATIRPLAEIKELISSVIDSNCGSGALGYYATSTSDSVLVQSKGNNGVNTFSSTVEFFGNGGIKASIPLALVTDEAEKYSVLRYLVGVKDESTVLQLRPIGFESLKRVMDIAVLISDYTKCVGAEPRDYLVKFEREALQGTVLYTNAPEYLEVAAENGLPFCAIADGMTRTRKLAPLHEHDVIISEIFCEFLRSYCLFDDFCERKGFFKPLVNLFGATLGISNIDE